MSLSDIPQDVIKLIYLNFANELDTLCIRCTCKLYYELFVVKRISYVSEFKGKLMIITNHSTYPFECKVIDNYQKSIILMDFDYKFDCYKSIIHYCMNGQIAYIEEIIIKSFTQRITNDCQFYYDNEIKIIIN
jgi:hypothetical protein